MRRDNILLFSSLPWYSIVWLSSFHIKQTIDILYILKILGKCINLKCGSNNYLTSSMVSSVLNGCCRRKMYEGKWHLQRVFVINESHTHTHAHALSYSFPSISSRLLSGLFLLSTWFQFGLRSSRTAHCCYLQHTNQSPLKCVKHVIAQGHRHAAAFPLLKCLSGITVPLCDLWRLSSFKLELI